MLGATAALASGQRRLDTTTPDYDAQDDRNAAVWRLVEPGGEYDPQAADNFIEAVCNLPNAQATADAVRAQFSGNAVPLAALVTAYWLARAEE